MRHSNSNRPWQRWPGQPHLVGQETDPSDASLREASEEMGRNWRGRQTALRSRRVVARARELDILRGMYPE